jgi:hypothetical protein
MLAASIPSWTIGPHAYQGAAVSLMEFVPDVDATVKTALHRAPKWSGRSRTSLWRPMGTIETPFGHQWYVATHVEDVPPRGDEQAGRGGDGEEVCLAAAAARSGSPSRVDP